jgi:hypothetical protein
LQNEGNKFVQKEFGGDKMSPSGLSWFWWVIALIVLAAFVCFWLR